MQADGSALVALFVQANRGLITVLVEVALISPPHGLTLFVLQNVRMQSAGKGERVGTVMDLTLKLPGHPERIRAQGTVRWVREFSDASDTVPGMGLTLALDDRDLARIRRFLSTRPPLFFDDA